MTIKINVNLRLLTITTQMWGQLGIAQLKISLQWPKYQPKWSSLYLESKKKNPGLFSRLLAAMATMFVSEWVIFLMSITQQKHSNLSTAGGKRHLCSLQYFGTWNLLAAKILTRNYTEACNCDSIKGHQVNVCSNLKNNGKMAKPRH